MSSSDSITSSVSADIQVTHIRIPARPSMNAGNFERPGLRLLIIKYLPSAEAITLYSSGRYFVTYFLTVITTASPLLTSTVQSEPSTNSLLTPIGKLRSIT